MRLADGRNLGFAEWGSADGRAVVWHPGTPGSCRSFLVADTAARAGLRVIVVERPGFGRSDFQDRRSILDWPRDLSALADRLALGRFAVAGMSGAGPYLLAAASQLHARITRVFMVACIGPLDAPDATRGMDWSRRLLFAFIRHAPRLMEKLLSATLNRDGDGTDDFSTPVTMARSMAAKLPSAKLRILEGEGHLLLLDHAEEILAAAA